VDRVHVPEGGSIELGDRHRGIGQDAALVRGDVRAADRGKREETKEKEEAVHGELFCTRCAVVDGLS
jgi:hypothetical protein